MCRETVPDAAYQSFLGKYAGLRAGLPHTASHLLVIGRVADPDSIKSVWRIRDVYPGSLIFTHPGSRISDPGSKNSNKRER
jgi:hypothetical protein